MKTRQQRAKFIQERLNDLYPVVPIPLDHTDPFTLLIAVLLSAQCTDKRVNLVTPKLFKLASTPETMSKLSIEKITACIKSCGIANNKAKNIHALSHMLINKFNSVVPDTFTELEELPGVGHKTASVVMIHAFKKPAFPVDTHIHRLAQRWQLTSGKSVIQTEEDLKKLFPESSWEQLHLQLITYGREHCSARGCDGTICQICRSCFPNRKKPIITHKA